MDIQQVIQFIWPLILIQVLFQIYALVDLIVTKKRKTKNLTPVIWILIIVLGEVVGPALYFLLGRSEE